MPDGSSWPTKEEREIGTQTPGSLWRSWYDIAA